MIWTLKLQLDLLLNLIAGLFVATPNLRVAPGFKSGDDCYGYPSGFK